MCDIVFHLLDFIDPFLLFKLMLYTAGVSAAWNFVRSGIEALFHRNED